MKKIIVFDAVHDLANNNKCFDPKYADWGGVYFFYSALYNEAKKHSIDCITGDIFLQQPENKEQTAFLISELHTSRTNRIIKKGAIPAICLSLEPPLIARDFYHFMKSYSGKFLHSYQFEGAKQRLEGTKTQFHTMYFPIHSKSISNTTSWSEKKYMVLINSNRRAFFSKYDSIKNILHTHVSQLKYWLDKAVDPLLQIDEIYVDRIEVINYFSKYDDFFLYGKGWNEHILGANKESHAAAKKAWKGTIDFTIEKKLECMSQFKFALCFENTAFKGYVTEKIFDAFIAGCIPIYYGAPDIEQYIPKESFIDYRNFSNMNELDEFLQKITENEAMNYLSTAKKFLNGPAFEKFKVDTVVRNLISHIHLY